ncbi:MAG: hypothetical protein ACFB0C_13650 [Leptolyngbyaceae cyanobacterium]
MAIQQLGQNAIDLSLLAVSATGSNDRSTTQSTHVTADQALKSLHSLKILDLSFNLIYIKKNYKN